MTYIMKNVMSLETEHRENELLAELELHDWDIVFLNETWRADVEEKWETNAVTFSLDQEARKGKEEWQCCCTKKLNVASKVFTE